MRPIRGSNGIPVGKDGKVPFKAIVRRFHEVGSRRDADSTDSVVLPRELTPSQIREWWDDPSVCDIEGVDTEDSDIYSVPISIRGKKRAALSKIAVLADRKESARIKKVLADSFTADELERMASICISHGVPIISDEIDCEIVMPGYSYTPLASISPEISRNTVTFCSPSKAFNIAGLQIANIITCREDWRKAIDKAININEICDVNPFGVAALVTAYTNPEAEQWLSEMNSYVYANYRRLREIFASRLPWMPISRLEGTYLAWCDCRKTGLASREIEAMLVDRFNVHVNAGSMYGEAGEGFIRINLACPRELLDEGLKRIADGLSSVR